MGIYTGAVDALRWGVEEEEEKAATGIFVCGLPVGCQSRCFAVVMDVCGLVAFRFQCLRRLQPSKYLGFTPLCFAAWMWKCLVAKQKLERHIASSRHWQPISSHSRLLGWRLHGNRGHSLVGNSSRGLTPDNCDDRAKWCLCKLNFHSTTPALF